MSDRSLARLAGVLYLVTFATSIPALALKQPFLDARGELNPAGAHWAIVLEILLALSCLGTAVVLFPVLRRFDAAMSLGFVGSRALEASTVLVGVIALLALIDVDPGTDAAALLVAVHDAAFLVGPGLLPAVNALLFATLLHRARLVPRIIPIIGVIGAPLLLASAGLSVFGVLDQVSGIAGIAALPIAVWEFTIGVWMIAKGLDTESRAARRPHP